MCKVQAASQLFLPPPFSRVLSHHCILALLPPPPSASPYSRGLTPPTVASHTPERHITRGGGGGGAANRTRFALFGMQNRTFRSYLMAINRIFISVMPLGRRAAALRPKPKAWWSSRGVTRTFVVLGPGVQYIDELNGVVEAMAAADDMLYYKDCASLFLTDNGHGVNGSLFGDYVHPNKRGADVQ
jgi:hypothetical protein